VLKLLKDVAGLDILLATALAVEAAVIHNFCWHRIWTWGERGVAPTRFLHFQMTTGLVSMAGNLVGMSVAAGVLHVPLIPANLAAIAMTHVFNYVVADRFVFRLR
jgi:putative flippase GtrA